MLKQHRILSEALSHAVNWGLASHNVALSVHPPRPQRKPIRTLNPDELQRLINAVPEGTYREIVRLDSNTGMRRSEILGLGWKDVDLTLATIHIVRGLHQTNGGDIIFEEPKSRSGKRQIALIPEAVIALRKYAEGRSMEGLVFCNDDGSPINPSTFSHVFSKAVHKAGLDGVRFHDLRHTHATLLCEQGIHPKIVAERLGHSSIAITLDLYSHVTMDMQREAIKRFGEILGLQTEGRMPNEGIENP